MEPVFAELLRYGRLCLLPQLERVLEDSASLRGERNEPHAPIAAGAAGHEDR